MEEADDIGEGDGDYAHDVETDLEVGEEKHGHDKDGRHGQGDVPPQLEADDLVGLPGGVYLAVGEGVGGAGGLEQLGD